MQTFLPYGFTSTSPKVPHDMETKKEYFMNGVWSSIECLDSKRLDKQRLEAMQIYLRITKGNGEYPHHPVINLWVGGLPFDSTNIYSKICVYLFDADEDGYVLLFFSYIIVS